MSGGWLGGGGGAGTATYEQIKMQVFDTYTGKATAALGTTDSGHTLSLTSGSPAAGLTIVNGYLTNTVTLASQHAGYGQIDLGAPVTAIGAEFVFEAGSTFNGTIALPIWKTPITAGGPVPDSPMHLTINPVSWGVGYFTGGSINVSGGATGTFETPLTCDGTTVYRVEAYIVGNDIHLLLPDGKVAIVTDSRTTSNAGQWACFEVFQTVASTDARPKFVSLWADAAPMTPSRTRSGVVAAIRAAQGQKMAAMPRTKMYAPSSTVNVSIPTTSTAIDGTNLRMSSVIVPDSGYLLVEFDGTIIYSGGGYVSWIINLSGSNDIWTQQVGVSPIVGRAHMSQLIGPYAPGMKLDIRWHHKATATGGSMPIGWTQGQEALMTVTPVVGSANVA